MKKVVNLLVIIISLTSCGQSNSKKNMKTIEDISNIYKEVEHFPLEPHYGIYISSSNTNFEIRVNDIPVFLGYEFITNDISPKGSYLPINLAISKSGIQTIEVRMYPSYNRQTQVQPSSNLYVKRKKHKLTSDLDIQYDLDITTKIPISIKAMCDVYDETTREDLMLIETLIEVTTVSDQRKALHNQGDEELVSNEDKTPKKKKKKWFSFGHKKA